MPLGGLTVEFVEEVLSDFSYKFEGDQDFVDKLNSLSQSLHLEADAVIDETLAYASNLKKTELDVDFLDAFEQYYKKKKAPASVSKPRAVLADLKPTTAGTPRRTTKLDVSSMEIDDDLDITLPRFDCVNAPPHVNELAMIESAAGPGWFVNRVDSGKVVAKLGDDVAVKRTGKKAPFAISIKSLAAASESCEYGEPKAAAVLEGMNARLEAYGMDVRAANAAALGDAPYASLTRDTESDVFILGFVADFDAHGDVSTMDLVRDEPEGVASVTVDVTGLDERCFFPGQMAVFSGVNRTGKLFEAKARLTAGAQAASVVQPAAEDGCVWVAAGPFTPPTTAAYEPLAEVVHRALQERPDVLVLMGPLVDRQSRFLLGKECTMGDTELTHALLTAIGKKMKGRPTRVVYVPSASRDAAVLPVYPGAALREPWKGEGVEIVSDPAAVIVSGAELVMTTSDIITHLLRTESHASANKENTDRMSRVAGHILEQRSLYPLNPPLLAASLEGLHAACTLNGTQPHVVVAPAMLAPFVKSAYGAVIVNPGIACKGSSVGTLAKIRIALSEIPEGGTSDLEKYTHVSVVKI